MAYLKVSQTHYGLLEIDDKEKDIVQVFNHQERGMEVIQIERDKLQEFINQLENCL